MSFIEKRCVKRRKEWNVRNRGKNTERINEREVAVCDEVEKTRSIE